MRISVFGWGKEMVQRPTGIFVDALCPHLEPKMLEVREPMNVVLGALPFLANLVGLGHVVPRGDVHVPEDRPILPHISVCTPVAAFSYPFGQGPLGGL